MNRELRTSNIMFYIILLIFFINSKLVFSQWIPTSPATGNVYCFASSGTNLFAGVPGNGVLRSTNNGASWTPMNDGLTDSYIADLIFLGSNLFAATNGGAFKSTNNGLNWTPINNGLTTPTISSFAISGTNLFAGTGNRRVFRSTDNGENWNSVGTGLDSNNYVFDLEISGSNIFAGTSGGAYLSTNSGSSWTGINNGLANSEVLVLSISGSNIFAGTQNSSLGGGGVYLSTNNGSRWDSVNNGLPRNYYNGLITYNSNVFAGTHENVYLSTNNGANWTNVSNGLAINVYTKVLAVFGSYLFLGTETSSGNVWRRPLSEMIGIQSVSTEVPDNFQLGQNYPNPFNPLTNIEFSIQEKSDARITVYDVQGKVMAVLLDQRLTSGTYKVNFDGINYASGIYFYKLEVSTLGKERFSKTRRMVLVK